MTTTRWAFGGGGERGRHQAGQAGHGEAARRRAQMLLAPSTITAVWSLVIPRSIPSRRTGDGKCMTAPPRDQAGTTTSAVSGTRRPPPPSQVTSPNLAAGQACSTHVLQLGPAQQVGPLPVSGPWQVPWMQSTARDDPASRASQSRTCGAFPDQPGVPCNPEPQQRSTHRGSLHEPVALLVAAGGIQGCGSGVAGEVVLACCSTGGRYSAACSCLSAATASWIRRWSVRLGVTPTFSGLFPTPFRTLWRRWCGMGRWRHA